jgi:two-component system chemotaxis response regulator CheB
MQSPIRVLVVDDSAFARKVLRQMLAATDIEVIGAARDGLEALEQIATLKPDVVTLDLVMPNLDGVGVLRALPEERAPRVVVVSITHATSELGVEALQAGAIRLIQKPTSLATEQLYELKDELLAAVREAAQARRIALRPMSDTPLPRAASSAGRQIVVIGTSTGGPQALTRLLAELPQDFPAPLAIALHIPAGYTGELAKRLDTNSRIDVVEAADGLELRPGLAVLARGGLHLKIARTSSGLYVHVGPEPRDETHAPSVDVLFESAAEQLGSGVLGVVLTGMGSDGLRGARAIHRAGGTLLTEAEPSCVVYGMPRVVKEAGLAKAEARLEDMALAIVQHV